MNFIGQDKATYTYLLRYLCTDEVPTPNELSKFYVVRSPKTPMCDSDIDSSHQKPPNKMSNSVIDEVCRSMQGFLCISFAIYVLKKSLHLTHYRNFMSQAALKPQCVIVISIPLIKSRRMRYLTHKIMNFETNRPCP